MESKDEIAQRVYGAPFGQLSLFAQAAIESQAHEQGARGIQAENREIRDGMFEERFEVLSRRVRNVELENEEL